MSRATTYLPPRQPHQPVQRIAKWALITISTVVIVGGLYLFFRGTQPRYVKFMEATPSAHLSPIADGWVQGLPDHPISTDPPPKPPPPVDAEARRELLRLQQQMRDRDEQMHKSLEEIRKLVTQQKPASAPASTPKTIKRPRLGFMSHELKDEEARVDDRILAPGTFIQGILQPTLNSEVEGYFTMKTTRPVFDSVTGQTVLIPQGQSIVAKDTSSALLFGNERIPTFAVTLSLPGGRSVDLGDAPVMDATGTNGLTGEVFNHTWRIVWTSILRGGLEGGQQMLQQVVASENGGAIASGIVRQGNAVSQQRLGRAQDTRPTIVAHAGEIVNVLVTKPIRIPATVRAHR
jgi:type IV secretory pathway VirB10-like protein